MVPMGEGRNTDLRRAELLRRRTEYIAGLDMDPEVGRGWRGGQGWGRGELFRCEGGCGAGRSWTLGDSDAFHSGSFCQTAVPLMCLESLISLLVCAATPAVPLPHREPPAHIIHPQLANTVCCLSSILTTTHHKSCPIPPLPQEDLPESMSLEHLRVTPPMVTGRPETQCIYAVTMATGVCMGRRGESSLPIIWRV